MCEGDTDSGPLCSWEQLHCPVELHREPLCNFTVYSIYFTLFYMS